MYRIARTQKEIDDQLQIAETAITEGSHYPGMSYEEGIIYFFQWLVGEIEDKPFEEI